jgi:PST family polysaccharide transporter
MKYITGVNIVFKLVFIILVFIVVTSKEDYLYVPVLYTLGYYLGGIYALYVIIGKMHIKLYIPNKQQMWIYIKDSAPIFGTDLICTIKDKFNYLLLGMFSGMGNVVIYDLGMKIYTIVAKPSSIVGTVMFPRSAKTRSTQEFNKVLRIIVFMNIGLIIIVNVFLPWISAFFLNKQIDLLPLRLFTLAPLFSCTSAFIISNFCIARGYNKYVLYSIIFTTFAYLITLGLMYLMGFLHNLYAFVLLALISYMAEFAYRIYVYYKIKKIEND